MFPPPLWNTHDATTRGELRNNNSCEGWNNAFSQLVGRAHPTIWRATDSLRKDSAMASIMMQRNNKTTEVSGQRNEFDDRPKTLTGIGHNTQ